MTFSFTLIAVGSLGFDKWVTPVHRYSIIWDRFTAPNSSCAPIPCSFLPSPHSPPSSRTILLFPPRRAWLGTVYPGGANYVCVNWLMATSTLGSSSHSPGCPGIAAGTAVSSTSRELPGQSLVSRQAGSLWIGTQSSWWVRAAGCVCWGGLWSDHGVPLCCFQGPGGKPSDELLALAVGQRSSWACQ